MLSRRSLIQSLCASIPVFSLDQLLSAAPALGVQFVNVARQAGLNKKTTSGRKHEKYLLETTGCGVAFFDYDNDGWLDIFFVNGTRFDAKYAAGDAPVSRLYKNNRDGTFTDVTLKAGLARTGWGQGVCIGDYNNDGHEDLFVTLLGRLRAVSQQRRRHIHGCSGRRPASRRGPQPAQALEHGLCVSRLRPRRAPGSVRRELHRLRS